MKKLLALLLAMIMVLSMLALASCGGKDEDDDDEEVDKKEKKKKCMEKLTAFRALYKSMSKESVAVTKVSTTRQITFLSARKILMR